MLTQILFLHQRYFDHRLIFLGGWWCWDTKTCADRWNTSTILMTNKLWSQQISVDGIFSTSSTNNPDFYNANAVYIPYVFKCYYYTSYKLPLQSQYHHSILLPELLPDSYPLITFSVDIVAVILGVVILEKMIKGNGTSEARKL